MNSARSDSNSVLKFVDSFGLAACFVLFLVVEFFSKYQRYIDHTTDLQQWVKAIIALIVAGFILLQFRKTYKFLVMLSVLGLLFVAGQWTLNLPFEQQNLVVFGRFMFPLILFGFFNAYPANEKGHNSVFRFFEVFLWVNFALMIIGLITDIYVLKTYLGDRFGYNGMLITSATSTYVYLVALGYCYFKDCHGYWRNPLFWIVVLSSLLVGTKTLYLGLVLFAILLFLFSSFRYKKQFLAVGIVGLIASFYVLFYQVPMFSQIREEQGLVTAVLSYRDQLFLNQTWPYIQEQWGALNYLFGGVSDFGLRSQMDLVDLVFFWGVLGALVYLAVYVKGYFNFKLQKVHYAYFILLGIAVLISGNFFTYTSIPVYLLILREAIVNQAVEQE
ncbi:hypothetical protein [Gilvibacter sediminis]|uniref:hypothetical protein n=1 Tax=Gilvibacter sediminis TaxID=379071 RepID=UPI00234FEA11|nr:hypothetical protein [Gilvibacter sediminis]MDC7996784.1 hypothetical protein [Gilvibacter sediminis]